MRELLSRLLELNISLQSKGDDLEICDPDRTMTVELLADIKTHKSEILTLLKGVDIDARYDKIPKAPAKKYYNLSHTQKRLYFLHEFEKTSTAYNMPKCVRLAGAASYPRLNDAFRLLLTRHACLRTSFEMSNEGPVQQIASFAGFDIELLDAETASASPRIEEFIRPFDLARLPLVRVGLSKLGTDDHLLIMDMHHIIGDGISQELLIKDFVAIYNGQAPASTGLDFVDFTEWFTSEPQRKKREKHRNFWRKEFAGERKPLNLPTDFPRPSITDYSGSRLLFSIGQSKTAALELLAGNERATLFMVLLSIYYVLLSRLSNQNDITIGFPTAGRNHADLENVVGLFMNVIPLRNFPESKTSFREFLADVRGRTLACMDHQDCPFDEWIEDTGVDWDAGRSPLFDVLFDFVNYEQAEIDIPGLSIRPYPIERKIAKFDLSLSVVRHESGIRLEFEYSTELFREETIRRFAGYFERILSAVAADADIRIGEIGMIPDEEMHRILVEFNATGVEVDRKATLVTLFGEAVKASGDKPALVYEDRELSYREVDERSDRLAMRLRKEHGIGPERIVAIMAERSERMVIGMLGILKAGGAYLPIDPAYPQERVEHMLSDSGAELLLVSRGHGPELTYSGAVVVLEEAETGEGHPEPVNGPGDLCYMIYTSGSTGRPKGVMISHGNVVNFFSGMDARLPVGSGDRMLAITSISFDISVLELLWTLCRGVEVVIHPADISLNQLDRYVPQKQLSLDFSLLFFSSYDNKEADKYRLLMEAARFADREGFAAVWTPERHFHEFGGLYPNPSLTSAALAMITSRLELRSGSVVAPLHDPIRMAEEWAVVDNLSNGRVALSFASGWNPNDFAISGSDYNQRNKDMYEKIETVRKLWRGENITRVNGIGKEVELRVFPSPIQKELPVWITSGGTGETFRKAGELGANLLTHLLGQSLEDLAKKIGIYRESWERSGHPGAGKVAIMLHTYIGKDVNVVERMVEGPFIDYLKSSIGLSRILNEEAGIREEEIPEERKALILKNAFRRYYKTGSLIGTKSSCAETITKLQRIGVDEVACLVDFGMPRDIVLDGLKNLKDLQTLFSGCQMNNRRPITMMQSTPSFMRMVLEGIGSGGLLGSLRCLLLGGEAIPPVLVKQLRGLTKARIFNMYGPTETAIWSCVHEFGEEMERVLVGRPIANTRIYILDKELGVVPVGVAGELYIGGEGVSRGYWGRPELTAERFIVSRYEEGRIYKTGDIARWDRDGNIELLGREDQQVKIRGHRIELGEIESQLSAYEGIMEAVVVAREKDGEKYLAAYYVTEEQIGAGALRNYLSGKYPPYMIPSRFMRMERLPLTANGKIDRKALPEPEAAEGKEQEKPLNETEEKLAGIWSEVLKLEQGRIGMTTDFFELGGHSLNAMILVKRIEKKLDRNIPLKMFYSMPAIRDIARYIDAFSDTRIGAESREKQKEYTF